MPSDNHQLSRWWWLLFYIRENLRVSFVAWDAGERIVTFALVALPSIIAVVAWLGLEGTNSGDPENWKQYVGWGLIGWYGLLLTIITPARMWKASQPTREHIVLGYIERAIQTARNYRTFIQAMTLDIASEAAPIVDSWQSDVIDELRAYKPYLASHFITGPRSPVDRFAEDGNFTIERILMILDNGIEALIEIRDRIDSN